MTDRRSPNRHLWESGGDADSEIGGPLEPGTKAAGPDLGAGVGMMLSDRAYSVASRRPNSLPEPPASAESMVAVTR